MTSRSRKKHPTTAPSTHAAKATSRPLADGLFLAVALALLTTPAVASDGPIPTRRFARYAPSPTAESAATSDSSGDATDANDEAVAETPTPLRRGIRLRWRAPDRKKPTANSKSPSVTSVSLSRQERASKPQPPKRITRSDDSEKSSLSFSRRADYTDDAFNDPFGDLRPVRQAQATELPAAGDQPDPIPFDDQPEPEVPLELPEADELPPLEQGPPDQRGVDELEDILRDSLAQRGLSDYCPSPDDLKRIYEITNDISPEPGEFPEECPIDTGPFVPRQWGCVTYTWKASGLCHKPLYFEERSLERYGHSWGPLVQPWMSAAHFFGTMPALPYAMGMNPPWECKYPLGYYRPGSCAPYLLYPVPLSLRGAAVSGAAWTGGMFLIP